MTHVTKKMDGDNVSADSFSFGYGRGKSISELLYTPIRGAANTDSPAFCSTRIMGHAASHGDILSALPDTSDPALTNLITHIAQQVGQTTREQLRGECEERDVGATQAQSSASQLPSDYTYLNLTGAKLVLQSDVRASSLQGRWI